MRYERLQNAIWSNGRVFVCVCWHQMRQRFVSFVWCIRIRKWYMHNVWEYMRLVIDCCRWYHIHICVLTTLFAQKHQFEFPQWIAKVSRSRHCSSEFLFKFCFFSILHDWFRFCPTTLSSLCPLAACISNQKKKNTTNTHAQAHTSCQYFFPISSSSFATLSMFHSPPLTIA